MKILMISTVREFFRRRAGMFFVVLGILLGFMSSREHYFFAMFFLTDAFGMYYLFAIWLVYALLCGQFVLKLWSLPEYNFIYQTRLWGNPKRFSRFFLMALGLLQPLIYYGVYVISIAKQEHLLHRVWLLFLFYLLFGIVIIFVAEWRICNPFTFSTKQGKVFQWPFPRPVSWIYWSVEWLFREKGLTLLVCKMGAAGAVLGTLLYYSTDKYDLRLPAIGMSLGYLLNIGLSYELFVWESEIWLWNRSLPLTGFQRFLRIVLVHALILLPETLVALRQGALLVTEILQLYVLGLSLIILFHTYLYKKKGLLEEMMQTILIGFVILTLLILYKIPVLVLAGVATLIAYVRFPRWYQVA